MMWLKTCSKQCYNYNTNVGSIQTTKSKNKNMPGNFIIWILNSKIEK